MEYKKLTHTLEGYKLELEDGYILHIGGYNDLIECIKNIGIESIILKSLN